VVEEAVADTGRDDIGVGAISKRPDGLIAVEFSRGTRRHTAEIPLSELRDHSNTSDYTTPLTK
jgi:hypothetical protein